MTSSGEGPTAQPDASLTPGEWLRAERDRQRLSIQQAAEDLHLDVKAVEALEANRFSTLGAPVYARGHLRKYAQLLNLSPEEVLRRYEALTAPTPTLDLNAPSASSPPAPERTAKRGALFWIGAVAAAALLIWGVSRMASAPEPAAETGAVDRAEAPAAQPSTAATQTDAQTQTHTETPTASNVTTPSAVQQPTPPRAPTSREPVSAAPATSSAPDVAPARASANASGPQVALRLEFNGESWTEVYDAAGAQLMFGMGAPGRVRELSGVAPLHVTIGAAGAVTAAVNGESVVIPRRVGREFSRFTVDASGAVSPAGPRRAE